MFGRQVGKATARLSFSSRTNDLYFYLARAHPQRIDNFMLAPLVGDDPQMHLSGRDAHQAAPSLRCSSRLGTCAPLYVSHLGHVGPWLMLLLPRQTKGNTH